MTEPLCKWCGTPQYAHNTDFTCGINTKGWGHRWDIRTEPRRKDLFDEKFFWLLIGGYIYGNKGYPEMTEKINDFIQSEIKRNLKEFAEGILPKPHGCMGIFCSICKISTQIIAKLKERGIE